MLCCLAGARLKTVAAVTIFVIGVLKLAVELNESNELKELEKTSYELAVARREASQASGEIGILAAATTIASRIGCYHS